METALKVLTDQELLHVIGGTDDPSKPEGDPGDYGENGGEVGGAMGQWINFR